MFFYLVETAEFRSEKQMTSQIKRYDENGKKNILLFIFITDLFTNNIIRFEFPFHVLLCLFVETLFFQVGYPHLVMFVV